jgi:hypothetical protein
MKYAYPSAAPHKRGRVRTYLFQGLNQFHIRTFAYGVHALLHLSVFLFLCGISDYLYVVYPRIGTISWYCVITSAVAYAALSISPLIIGNCPYETALTPPLAFGLTLLIFSGHTVLRWLRRGKGEISSWRKVNLFDKTIFLVKEASERAANLDPYAMEWLFTDDDFSDTDMDKLLEGFPGYIHSRITQAVKKELPKVLTTPHILHRMWKHLITCVTAIELTDEARLKRVLACVESLRIILHLRTSAERLNGPDEELPLRRYMQSTVANLNTLCRGPEERSDLRAFCVRALAFQGFLTKCLEPSLESAREGSPDVKIPGYFIPLHEFFSSVTLQYVWHTAVADEEPTNEDTMRTLPNDAPFINLALLAKAILSHHDDVDPSTLSLCWKTLDILRTGFRINRTDLSGPSLKLFDDVHSKTRSRVGAEEPGFSVIPLLEVLDAVDGGRRLSKVFQDHPDPKYHCKADLVFGKDHIRSPDLFRAFAHCLPHFVTHHPKQLVVELMEGLVLRDHLWTSLQAHLANSLRPNSSIQTMLHVFEMCCSVIDVAFVALENTKMDWRAPDFGTLAHYFELFVTNCFQGIFIERAIAFRVGLIKARFCIAILAQFLDEFSRSGTVIFRSHWDVASLARVFYSLGVGDDADVEFWKSLR